MNGILFPNAFTKRVVPNDTVCATDIRLSVLEQMIASLTGKTNEIKECVSVFCGADTSSTGGIVINTEEEGINWKLKV